MKKISKQTNEILNKIRELADLKKLEKGCRFWVYDGDHKNKLHCEMVSDTYYQLDKYQTKNHYIWEIDEKQILESGGEIIGLPVHLEHLIYAIKKSQGEEDVAKGVLESSTSASILAVLNRYEWAKSVEQNLNDNEELRELLANLLLK